MARRLVATDVVRFVGEIVAIVVSEERAVGLDAAEALRVDYEPLPVVIEPGAAATDELLLFPELGTTSPAWTQRRSTRTSSPIAR